MKLHVLDKVDGNTFPSLSLVSMRMKELADHPKMRDKFYLLARKGTTPEVILIKLTKKCSLISVTMSEEDLTVSVLEKLAGHGTLTTLRKGLQPLRLHIWLHPLFNKLYS